MTMCLSCATSLPEGFHRAKTQVMVMVSWRLDPSEQCMASPCIFGVERAHRNHNLMVCIVGGSDLSVVEAASVADATPGLMARR